MDGRKISFSMLSSLLIRALIAPMPLCECCRDVVLHVCLPDTILYTYPYELHKKDKEGIVGSSIRMSFPDFVYTSNEV